MTLSAQIGYYVTSVTAAGLTDGGVSVEFDIIQNQCKSDLVRADISGDVFSVALEPPKISFMAFAFSSRFLPLDITINIKC